MRYEALERAKRALEGGDADAMAGCYTEPCVYDDIPSGEILRTREELRAMYRRAFTPPTVFTDVRVREGDGWASVEWTWSGVNRKTGSPVRFRGASVIEMRDGLIAKETLFYDPRPALA